MTKYEWETELKKCMHRLPKDEQAKVLEYYNELFADRIESGMSEKQVIAEFGNPADVAYKIVTDYGTEEEKPRVTAPPDFYSGRKKESEKISPPDFWEGRSGAKKPIFDKSEEQRYEKRAKTEQNDKEGKSRGVFSTLVFAIEFVLLIGLFIGLSVTIVSLLGSVLIIGYSFAAGSVGVIINAVMPGLAAGARVVEFAAALLMAAVALAIIPNTVTIIKTACKGVAGLWNGLFGWYTKRKEA